MRQQNQAGIASQLSYSFRCLRQSQVILNAVERELSVVVQGSAASEVVLVWASELSKRCKRFRETVFHIKYVSCQGAYRVGYELFETRYRRLLLSIHLQQLFHASGD